MGVKGGIGRGGRHGQGTVSLLCFVCDFLGGGGEEVGWWVSESDRTTSHTANILSIVSPYLRVRRVNESTHVNRLVLGARVAVNISPQV